MLRALQRMPRGLAERCVASAMEHPLANPAVTYPAWYVKRWHCLPEGYLSARSAALYDRGMRRVYWAGLERRVAGVIAAECRERGATSLLDLGCGAGSLLRRVASRAPGVIPSGVELSPFLAEMAARRMGLSVVHDGVTPAIFHGDAAALPYADASFDVVVAAHLLGHVPSAVAERVVGEAGRVIRAGGLFVRVDHAWHDVAPAGFALRRERRVAGGIVRIRLLQQR